MKKILLCLALISFQLAAEEKAPTPTVKEEGKDLIDFSSIKDLIK